MFFNSDFLSSQAAVYTIDDLTGGLELSHTIELSAKDFPGSPGYVREMKWTPDCCAVMLSWSKGGISLWSTFGAMLMCSLGWDYGLNVDLALKNPLDIACMVSYMKIHFQSFIRIEINFVSNFFSGLVHGRLSIIYVATAKNLR